MPLWKIGKCLTSNNTRRYLKTPRITVGSGSPDSSTVLTQKRDSDAFLTSFTGFSDASTRILSTACWPLSAFLHASVTLAPIFASSRAVAYPIPVLAPVTTKTFPRRSWAIDFALESEVAELMFESQVLDEHGYRRTCRLRQGSKKITFILNDWRKCIDSRPPGGRPSAHSKEQTRKRELQDLRAITGTLSSCDPICN